MFDHHRTQLAQVVLTSKRCQDMEPGLGNHLFFFFFLNSGCATTVPSRHRAASFIRRCIKKKGFNYVALLTWINQPRSQSLRITAITIPKRPFFSLMVLNWDNQLHNQLKVPRCRFMSSRNEAGTVAYCLSWEQHEKPQRNRQWGKNTINMAAWQFLKL